MLTPNSTAPVYHQVYAFALVYQLIVQGQTEDAKPPYDLYGSVGRSAGAVLMSH